jgi:phage terminase small subunit
MTITTNGRKKSSAAKPRVKAGTSKAMAAQRRALFTEAYLTNGGNATNAAIAAGYSPNGADVVGTRLLGDVSVATAIAARRAEALAAAQQNTGVTIERTLRELARLAYVDPRRMFDSDGKMLQIHQLPDDVAPAVAQFERVVEYKGNGEDRVEAGYTTKVKLWDKVSAIEKAMKHLGLFEKDNAQRPQTAPAVFVVMGVEPMGVEPTVVGGGSAAPDKPMIR